MNTNFSYCMVLSYFSNNIENNALNGGREIKVDRIDKNEEWDFQNNQTRN